MSLWDIHYDALYASPIAVDAVLTVACGDPPMALRAIDKTAGIVINGSERDQRRFTAEVQTVSPAVAVRAGDLADVEKEKLQGAEITFNGKTWLVDTHAFRPSPMGEGAG
jgi:hypothetical protein